MPICADLFITFLSQFHFVRSAGDCAGAVVVKAASVAAANAIVFMVVGR